MRVLVDRIRRNGYEWRIVARSDGVSEVWTSESVAEFRTRDAAYQYVAMQHRNAKDYREYKPGQRAVIQTTGGPRELTVLRNSPKAITLVDAGGEQFTLPHRQDGVEHYRSFQFPEAPERGQIVDRYAKDDSTQLIGYCQKCREPIQGSRNYSMEDHMLDVHGIPTSKREAGKFNPFDQPPVFPEGKPKVESRPYRCMNCGHEQMITTNHVGKVIDYCKGCSWKPSYGESDNAVPGPGGRTFRPFEYAGPSGRTVIQSEEGGTFETHEKPSIGHLGPNTYYTARQAADIAITPYYCRIDHTPLVPHTPSDARKVCPDCGSVYTAKKILSARDIIAQPMGPQTDLQVQQEPQAVPQAEMGQSEVGTGRVLSRHELIQEAETLIRNALHQGVKIGVYDLTKYMSDQYGNTPEEILEAAQYSWKKVQFEDEDNNETSPAAIPGQQPQSIPGGAGGAGSPQPPGALV